MPLKAAKIAGLKHCLLAGVVYALIISSILFVRFRYSALHYDYLMFDLGMIWKVESGRFNTWIVGTDGSIAYLCDLAYFMRRWPEHRNVLKIAAFNRELQKLGVKLILMPVPSEIHIYPERYIKNRAIYDPSRMTFCINWPTAVSRCLISGAFFILCAIHSPYTANIMTIGHPWQSNAPPDCWEKNMVLKSGPREKTPALFKTGMIYARKLPARMRALTPFMRIYRSQPLTIRYRS